MMHCTSRRLTNWISSTNTTVQHLTICAMRTMSVGDSSVLHCCSHSHSSLVGWLENQFSWGKCNYFYDPCENDSFNANADEWGDEIEFRISLIDCTLDHSKNKLMEPNDIVWRSVYQFKNQSISSKYHRKVAIFFVHCSDTSCLKYSINSNYLL